MIKLLINYNFINVNLLKHGPNRDQQYMCIRLELRCWFIMHIFQSMCHWKLLCLHYELCRQLHSFKRNLPFNYRFYRHVFICKQPGCCECLYQCCILLQQILLVKHSRKFYHQLLQFHLLIWASDSFKQHINSYLLLL